MKNKWLNFAGVLSFSIAALHIIMIFVGAEAYRFFDAGEGMAKLAEQGSLVPHLITLIVTIVFAIFGLYAWSGAGIIKRVPLLKPGLIVISAIYSLRGVAFFGQAYYLIKGLPGVGLKSTIFSLVSLIIGIIYLAGTVRFWKTKSAPAV